MLRISILGSLLINLLLNASPTAADSCPSLTPIEKLSKPAGAVRGFQGVSRQFLNTLDHETPIAEIDQLINQTETLTWSDFSPLLKEQIPFLVLIALGILFVILLPLSGCIFCCCLCGASRIQKNPKNGVCGFLLIGSVLCFIAILSGSLMFVLSSSEFGVKEFQNDLNESVTILDEVTGHFEGIPNSAWCKTNSFFDDAEQRTQNTSNQFFAKTNATVIGQLRAVLKVIQKAKQAPEADTSDLAKKLENITNDSKTLLSALEREQFVNKTSTLGSLKALISSSESAQQKVSIASSEIQSISIQSFLANNEKNASDAILKAEQSTRIQIQSNIESARQKVEEPLRNLNKSIASLSNYTESLKSEVGIVQQQISDGINSNGKYTSLAESLVLVFPVPIWISLLLVLVGLICGCAGYRDNAEPYERTTTSNVGGNCLLWATCPLFTFAWILMVLTIILFAAGYFANTLICRPVWEDPDLGALQDILSSLNYQLPSDVFGNKSIAQVFKECRANASLTSIVHVKDFDESQMNATVFNRINSTFVDVETVAIRGLDQVLSFFPPPQFAELEKALNTLQDSLLNIQRKVVGDSIIQLVNALKNEFTGNVAQLLSDLNSSLMDCKGALAKSEVDVKQLTAEISSTAILAQKHLLLNNLTKDLLEKFEHLKSYYFKESSLLLDQIYGLAHCGPIYTAYENAGVLICDGVISSVNGLWAGLGWSLIFVVPALFFWVALSKYFRKMREPEAVQMRLTPTAPAPMRTSLPRYDIVRPRNSDYYPQYPEMELISKKDSR